MREKMKSNLWFQVHSFSMSSISKTRFGGTLRARALAEAWAGGGAWGQGGVQVGLDGTQINAGDLRA